MGMSIPGSGVGGNFPYRLVSMADGNYRLEATQLPGEFTDLDLYLMGFLPAAEVGPQIAFQDQSQQICHGCILRGAVMITVNDLIAAEGRRNPDAARAQKRFRVATVVQTIERPLNDDEMALFDYFALRGEANEVLPVSSGLAKGTTKPFRLATRGIGSFDTTITKP